MDELKDSRSFGKGNFTALFEAIKRAGAGRDVMSPSEPKSYTGHAA